MNSEICTQSLWLQHPYCDANEGMALYTVHQAMMDQFLPPQALIDEREQLVGNSFDIIYGYLESSGSMQALREKWLGNIIGTADHHVVTQSWSEWFKSLCDVTIDYANKVYLSTIYSDPIINNMAEVLKPEAFVPHDCGENIYTSTLYLQDEVIQSRSGHFDYAIIGTGPAASLIAHQLVQEGFNVVMIEKGSFVTPGTHTTYQPVHMESQNSRTTDDGLIHIRNGMSVGGGTTVNVDLAFSPMLLSIQNKIQSWIDSGKLPAEFVHNEHNDFAKLADAYEWVTKHTQTRRVGEDEINANNALLFHATKTARTYYLNQKHPHAKDAGNLKISAVQAFLMSLLTNESTKGRLQIIPEMEVSRILHDGMQGIGIEMMAHNNPNAPCKINNLHTFKFSAHEVVRLYAANILVSAGTLGSSELLLRSNIHNDNVGRGLIMHPSIGVAGIFNHTIRMMEGLPASVYASSKNSSDDYFLEAMEADPSFVALLFPGNNTEIYTTAVENYVNLGGYGVMLIDSVSMDNRVYLDANGHVQVHYKISQADKVRFKKGIIEAATMMFNQGATRLFLPTHEPIYLDQDTVFFQNMDTLKEAVDKLELQDKRSVLSSAHMQATNKLGADCLNSVVSQNFKLWNQQSCTEYANIYVVDSSIAPTSFGANPMMSIYTFAKLFADKITTHM